VESPTTLRAVRSWDEALPQRGADEGVLEAMLLTAGALGYEKATVQEVLDRSGISRERFNRDFGGKEECFARAYEMAVDRLDAEVRDACEGAASWRAGFRAALATVLRTVAEQPLLAKALLIEVRAARGRAWETHQRALDRLARLVDTAREEPGARPATKLAAQFVVGAVEESICVEIGGGRAAKVERLLPDLCHLAVLQYFGEDEAWLELGSPELTGIDPVQAQPSS
jgi:AcrR family transcriptional regulator